MAYQFKSRQGLAAALSRCMAPEATPVWGVPSPDSGKLERVPLGLSERFRLVCYVSPGRVLGSPGTPGIRFRIGHSPSAVALCISLMLIQPYYRGSSPGSVRGNQAQQGLTSLVVTG